MSFIQTALSGEDYTAIRGAALARRRVVLNPNTILLAGQVNQSAFATSFAQVTYDSVTAGDYTDALAGYTVLFAHTDDISQAFHVARLRQPATVDTLYIDETSAAITDDDYVWVLKDLRLWDKKPRKVGSTIYFDYDQPFHELPPVIRNLQSVYAINLSAGVAEVALSPQALATASGASISTWAWLPDGGSFEVGDSSSQAVTLRYTAAGVYYPRVTITDSLGTSSWFCPRIVVIAADDIGGTTFTGFTEASVTGELGAGWDATLTVATDAISGVLGETEVYFIDEVMLNGTESTLNSRVSFIGRIDSESLRLAVRLRRNRLSKTSSVTLQLKGYGTQLGEAVLASAALQRSSAPAAYGQIRNLTVWRGIVFILSHLTTLTHLAALDFDDTGDDYSVPLLGTSQQRSAGDMVAETGYALNALFNMARSGPCYVARHAGYLNSSDRAALLRVADFTVADYSGQLALTYRHSPVLGRVMGYGGSYNTVSGKTTALRAIAPAAVWGRGQGRNDLNRQVLKINLSVAEMSAELAQRTGADFATKNPVDTLTAQQRSGYNFIEPNGFQLYTWTLSADETIRGRAYDTETLWYCTKVTSQYIAADMRIIHNTTYTQVAENVSAQVFAEVAPEALPAAVPHFPPFSTSPLPQLPSLIFPDGEPAADDEQPFTEDDYETANGPDETTTDPDDVDKPDDESTKVRQGSVVLTGNAAGMWLCQDFNLTDSPTWAPKAPVASGITHAVFDPHTKGAYLLQNDGTNTTVWHCSNLYKAVPDWTGTVVNGVYTQVRATSSAGKVYIYGSEGAASEVEVDLNYDFALNNGGWTPWHGGGSGATLGTYSAGNYWTTTDGRSPPAIGSWFRQTGIQIDFGDTRNVVAVEIELDVSFGGFIGGSPSYRGILGMDRSNNIALFDPGDYAGDGTTLSWAGDEDTDFVGFLTWVSIQSSSGALSGYARVTAITITVMEDQSPTALRYSMDSGQSFGAAIEVDGDNAINGGFDTRAIGNVAYAASSAALHSSPAGGALVDEETGLASFPLAIWSYGLSTNKYIYGTAGLIGADSVWNYSGSKTAITPDDGTFNGTVASQNSLTMSRTSEQHMWLLGNFGGVIKLAYTTDAGTGWAFNTALSSAANYVRVKQNNTDQVYIADNSVIRYSEDGGATLVAKTAPAASLLFVEVK